MKIEISDEAIKNDKQGIILNFLDFAEKIFEECPVLVDETNYENNYEFGYGFPEEEWIIHMDPNKFLTKMNFVKSQYTKEEAIEVFKEVVYGK
jgi:hypothetical protein